MMNRRITLAVLLTIVSLWGSPAAGAATYYVDFEGGSDDSDGLSVQAAFKHAPGDPAAAGKAKAAALAGGDVVRFKGGVEYRGTVVVPWSGQEGRPIVYDGNAGGGFGAGMAIVQGADPVAGWKKAASAQDVGGNPNWQRLYYTHLDAGRTFFGFSLYEGDTYLNVAQDPDPEIPFYHDRLNTYLRTATANQSSLADANYFTRKDEHYYDGAYIALFVRPAAIQYRRITKYEPAEHRVAFEAHRSQLYGGARGHQYSLLNSLKFLNRPGEYVIEEAAKGERPRLVLWPHKPGATGPEGVTISARRYGFEIKGASHVAIQGFRILQQGGDRAAGIVKSGAEPARDIVIRDNEIARVRTYPNRSAAIAMGRVEAGVVERNDIHENAYCAGLMLTHFDNSVARGNLLRKNGSTAIDYYNCHGSRIERNVIRDNLGMHANGITMYVGCTDILVQGNECYNANGVTTNDGNNIVIRNNIFDGGGAHTVMGLWASGSMNNLTIVNNLILNGSREKDWHAGIYIGNKGKGWVIRNNVIDGVAGEIQADAQFSHNIYTRLGDAQKGRALGKGERVVEDLRKLFVDPARRDYRTRPGSPAIDAGTDVGLKEDFAGTRVPQGQAPDIGAYEHVSGPEKGKPQ